MGRRTEIQVSLEAAEEGASLFGDSPPYVGTCQCSFIQPLAEGQQNEAFRSDMEGWSKIADQLYVWDYVTNFAHYIVPHPNLRVLGPNIRFFVDHNTIGLFEQGDAQSGIGDFVRMRAWVLSHLMWDHERDADALVDEFLTGYYGPAAPHLAAYLETLHDAAEKSGIYLRCFMSDTSGWLSLDTLNQATRHFLEALESVRADPVLSTRVRRERLPLDHVWLQRWQLLKRQAAREGKEFLGPSDPVAACYLWVAPPQRPGEVDAVYVDRFFFTREGESAKKE